MLQDKSEILNSILGNTAKELTNLPQQACRLRNIFAIIFLIKVQFFPYLNTRAIRL